MTYRLKGIPQYSQISYCKSLIGAPEIITGDFKCVINVSIRHKPGSLNGAPLKVGGYFRVYPRYVYSGSCEFWRICRHSNHFYGIKTEKIIPAFTDNKSRIVGKQIEIDMPHCGFNCYNTESYIMRQGLFIVAGESNTVPSELVKRMLPGNFER